LLETFFQETNTFQCFINHSGSFALYMYVVSRWKFVLYLYYFLNKDIHSYFDMIINIIVNARLHGARLIYSRIEIIG